MATVPVNALNVGPDARTLPLNQSSPYRRAIGVGGIGTGLFFALDGDHTLGRNESRSARLLDVRDYCKLHIVMHYLAVLLGAQPGGAPFHALPIGKVGDDEPGRRLIAEMSAVGIDTRWVARLGERPTLTSACLQYPDGTGGNITARDSAADSLTGTDVERCEPILARDGARSIILALPEVPLAARDHLLTLATKHGALRVAAFTSSEIGPAGDLGLFSRIDLIAMNEDEAAVLAGEYFDSLRPARFLNSCATALRMHQPRIRVVVSVGKHGAYAGEGGDWTYCPAPAVRAAGTAGAGDALLAGIVSALATGMPFLAPNEPGRQWDIASAVELGVMLAAYSVTSPHTIHPRANLPSLLAFARSLEIGTPNFMSRRMIEAVGGAPASADLQEPRP